MLIGYARVSTLDQDLTLQLDALTRAGCEKIYTDKASGIKSDRAGLADALAYAREGDSVVVWKLDRLGRSMKGLIDLAAALDVRKVDLISITDGINTKSAAGRFFFNVMAALATMERELILERTNAGLAAARRAGRVGGRKRSMTTAKLDAARTLLGAGKPHKEVAVSISISLPTLYRYFPAIDRINDKIG